MYDRPNGSPFTVRSLEEKKELVDIINSQKRISEFATCVGLDVEQFTGKINFVLMKMGNRYLKFRVTGTFPNMKLDHADSNNVFSVDFPKSERQKEFKVAQSEEVLTPVELKEEHKTKEVQLPKEPVEEKKEEKVNLPAVEVPVEVPAPSAPVVVESKHRGRKKKKSVATTN